MSIKSIAERELPEISSHQNWIGDRVVAGEGDVIDVVFPATGEVFHSFSGASVEQAGDAVAQARDSFDRGVWSSKPADERARVIERAGEILEARRDELAQLIVADNGKTIGEAHGDVFGALLAFPENARICREAGEVDLGADARGLERIVVRDPVGVVVGLAPYNAPLIFATLKALPALAAGNSVVLKPSERAPLLTLEVVKALYEAGLPAGVLSLVHGRVDVAQALTADSRIDMISLTGGTPAGTAVMQAAAPGIKNLLLELGGKSAHIILDDADLDTAIRGAAAAIFRNSGQRCFSGSRLVLHECIAERVEEELAALAQSIRQGDPFEPESQMGSLIDERAVEDVQSYLERAITGAIEVAAGGERNQDLLPGAFFRPTMLVGADNSSYAAQTEVFGPVVTCIRVGSEDEAIAVANDSSYGLAGGLWSQNRDRALSVARRIRTGTFWINTYGAIDGSCPFGGYGLSGMGREAGTYGYESYTELKSILIDPNPGSTAPLY